MEIKAGNSSSQKKVMVKSKAKKILAEKIMETLTELKSDFKEFKKTK